MIVVTPTTSLVVSPLLERLKPANRVALAIANVTRNAGLALVITVLILAKQKILPTIIV
uniref:Uncharacterized protein n=1 Tax=Cyanothece sp. (strain PCC 7425 / ATCC 29141) TaxID=395961 RepID=B8HXD8_CYAP4